MLIVIFVLPFFSSDSYSIMRNTTSQLGGQNMPNAWIMNTTFVLLGLTSILASWRFFERFWMPKILILIFGLAIIGTAIFSHAPIESHMAYNQTEDDLHSLFAKITGFSFTIFAATMAFIIKRQLQVFLAIGVAVIDTLLSATMFEFQDVTGLFQRLIFIISFGWLGYILIQRIELKNVTQRRV